MHSLCEERHHKAGERERESEAKGKEVDNLNVTLAVRKHIFFFLFLFHFHCISLAKLLFTAFFLSLSLSRIARASSEWDQVNILLFSSLPLSLRTKGDGREYVCVCANDTPLTRVPVN